MIDPLAAPDPPTASGDPALPSVGVLTMARDEGAMLRRWVTYYGDAVGRDNLLVIDDHSCDGSTEELDCRVVPAPAMPGGHAFETARMRLINRQARRLLVRHDFVIFVDVDEFLIPDPATHAGLRQFLAARRDVPVIAPMALNVVHHLRAEGPFDPDRPVLEQRHFAMFVARMCKPSIKQVDARWVVGGHGVDRNFAVDPELFMLHLKFFDQEHVQRTAHKRSAVVALDGRAPRSNWHHRRDVVRLAKQVTKSADPATVPEFDPAAVDLADVVVKFNDVFCTRRRGQVAVMRSMPLVRVPARLAGTL